MPQMYATKKNYRIVDKIIRTLSDEKISISRSCAILEYVKSKIAHDTLVAQPIKEDVSNLPEDV